MKGPSRLLLWKSGKSAAASRGSGVAALRSPVTAKMLQSCGERGGGSAHGFSEEARARARASARARARAQARREVRIRRCSCGVHGFRGSSSGPGEASRRACGVCEKRAEAVCGLSNAADSGVLSWRTLGAE